MQEHTSSTALFLFQWAFGISSRVRRHLPLLLRPVFFLSWVAAFEFVTVYYITRFWTAAFSLWCVRRIGTHSSGLRMLNRIAPDFQVLANLLQRALECLFVPVRL